MASRNYHRNRTKERKASQAHERRIRAMRERVIGFEGVTPTMAARMSEADLLHRIRVGGRRRMVSPLDGIALALAAGMYANQR